MKIPAQTVLDLLHTIIQPISADLVNHLQRTALISYYLGKRAGLDATSLRHVWLAAMLHDIGVLGKDREKLTLASEAFLTDHEELGAAMMEGITFLKPVVSILANHHADWREGEENHYPLTHYLVHLADEFELFLRNVEGDYIAQRHDIIARFFSAPKPWPPQLVDALTRAAGEDGFWFRLGNPSLELVLRTISPVKDMLLNQHDFLEICQLISKIVDKYSSFTRTHSTSVAHVAQKLAQLYGYDRETQQKICIAGYLHDLGKLFIPLNILEKSGKLEPEEYAQMKLHSYKTLVMLSPIIELHEIVHWAANHHERLDGSGYPFCLEAQDLDMPSRIMAVADVFTALTENRPYRQGMNKQQALAILALEAEKNRLDGDIITLLTQHIDSIHRLVVMH